MPLSICQFIVSKSRSQWLWRSWQSGRFQYQWTRVQIQSSATFIEHLLSVNCLYKRQKIKKKMPGMAHFLKKDEAKYQLLLKIYWGQRTTIFFVKCKWDDGGKFEWPISRGGKSMPMPMKAAINKPFGRPQIVCKSGFHIQLYIKYILYG